ncbi:uncharacterized protein GVI51_D00583 [Nakaseomyces glabratus]|uniref:Endoplasmic reticulum transmembrane protein n=1 Tax=Candida glabrata (strain ATCC 2001 / BCRC 20586 / JCM 3761 / NBRC 0622 / NRRL Y-65 / CBS 138) TaxID=284593 RepID=Q6FWF0_CANGA|nr:uncharacterized protein CAGL0D00704g [Nakaseomyces glabratus]KAH7589711.1 Bap31/Bap29 transmembrane region [Nakaseomyces glabratus]KAH7590791.1 Bap31/Bap29 transmembrane region [Nakaseomyces glabratus]KAH7596527.1 Bap31/Bap29 transmembrane region [Nakaseomyces glabratus]KAH7606384.1 Bap31/Bap29 transmembrane region [Nakaseomyces glabratus]KAH7608176.1 Bap31/Bap29 transmembrane region [Nakaseomyces glabratus]|eukprot:XP_445444.1 uncharacterized protein CAGL0D00704g [[Candida] glabrata]
MSLYYALVFGILVLEIAVFSVLSLPLPTRIRRPMMLVLLKPFRAPTVQVGIKCILGFILILFIDCITKVYNINRELNAGSKGQSNTAGATGGTVFAQDRIEVVSRKFLAQRNMYLTGITLFLTFVVVRTYALVSELFQLKDNYRAAEGEDTKGMTPEEAEKRRKELLEEIDRKEKEINRLTEKATLLQKEM